MSDEQADILAANAAFYTAFAKRDLTAMQTLWASSDEIACIHPGWGCLTGREQVMESWQAILNNPDSPVITSTEESVHMFGDAAFVTCGEAIEGDRPQLIATNYFVKTDAGWKLLHHHASPLIQDADIQSDSGPPSDQLH